MRESKNDINKKSNGHRLENKKAYKGQNEYLSDKENQGNKYDKGSQGSKGNHGDKGNKGSKGYQADKGNRGNQINKENQEYKEKKLNKVSKESKVNKENKKNQGIRVNGNKKERRDNDGIKQSKCACGHMKECGGCNVLLESYEEHLAKKQKEVAKLLNKYCKVEPIIGMKDPFHYRNKVHVVFDHDRKGNPISGIYEEKTHRVIPIDHCLIHNEKADEIIHSIRGLLKSFKIKTYDEDTGYGLLRHVLIRTGFTSGEIMVVLVLASPILPSKSNFVKALRNLHPEITTIVLNVNNKKTSMVLGEKENVIYGKGYIEDVLCEKIFHISPNSFYQVNPVQTEVLYKKAIEFADLKGTETIIDAYCGIGTIGLIASDHVKRVIGVELNKDAVRDAVINMKRNQITNAEIYNKDAGEFMRQVADMNETIDVVFMDPPRAGSDETFLSSIVNLKPKKVVYISCNPVTLDRDLQYLTKKGYKVERITPVDMFAWTGHIEVIIMMTYCSKKEK